MFDLGQRVSISNLRIVKAKTPSCKLFLDEKIIPFWYAKYEEQEVYFFSIHITHHQICVQYLQ